MLPFAAMINYYPVFNALFTRFEPKAVTEQRITHCRHSEERVDKRLAVGSTQPDIWNLVLEEQEKGNGLTLKEMHSNSEIFMLAGSETTGTYSILATDYRTENMKIRLTRMYCHSDTAEWRLILFALEAAHDANLD